MAKDVRPDGITEEVRQFLLDTGCKQSELASVSGLPSSTISMIVSGKRRHVYGCNQDRLRFAMRKLRDQKSSQLITF